MKSFPNPRRAIVALAAVLLVATGATQSLAQANTKGEGKCQSTLSKSIAKHAAAVAKAMAACQDSVIAGDIAGPCPDTTAQAAIDKSAASVMKTVPKKCQSACSVSAVPCIGSPQCPPNGLLTENCTAAGKNFFEAANMGFPGAFCPGLIGGDMVDPEDFGTCAAGLGNILSDELLGNIYGAIDGTPALSDAASSCLAAIVKSAPKSASKLAGAVTKCRIAQLTSDAPLFAANSCETADAKVADAITKTITKFTDTIDGACTDSAVAELDLCGNGIGGTVTVAAAKACLSDALEQVAFSIESPDDRAYAPVSIINGAFPDTAAASCGDGIVNQLPSQFLLLGEECDGADDSACPGECLPPGDTFECTCGNIPRQRTFADGLGADLDNGWTGASHNSKVTDRAGFVTDITNCDCSAFGASPSNAATCVGGTMDQVCDTFAETQPRCSNSIDSGLSCTQAGNGDQFNTDADCQACDAFATNAGDFCTGTARYCMGGTASGDRCNQDSDCPGFGGDCAGSGVCLDGPFGGNGCVGNQNCGICTAGSIGSPCATNANCGFGGVCETHTCATKSCMGGTNHDGACTADGQCPGGRCAETSDCGSQCYDANDVPTGPCGRQSDCAEGERCRGICNKENYCLIMRNGAPLPLSSEGTSVCIDSRLATNATGTRDIVTGSHAINYNLRSVTHLSGELLASPCPVCGGYCEEGAGPGGGLEKERCQGNCSGTATECRFGPNTGLPCMTNTDCADFLCAAVACRFDDDCPMGETCSGAGSPECGGDGCRLDLTCSFGPNEGAGCRIEAATAFGTTSRDCPPDPNLNISGEGLLISWTPLTSEPITLESPGACDAPDYENYDCNCITGGGTVRNQPNKCGASCNDPNPAYFGRPCADFTRCDGGAEDGAKCDSNADCSGGGLCTDTPQECGAGDTGTCSVNRCSGGSNAGNVCISNGNCPGGTCPTTTCTVGSPTACNSGADGECVGSPCTVDGDCDGGATCDSSCPAGLCVPLCLPRGVCNGGDNDGIFCALDQDCPGGGTCVPDDPFEGACAKGSFTHCNGLGQTFRTCLAVEVGTKKGCEWGPDGIQGTSDDYAGAGFCIDDIQNCFLNDGAAEGGDTLNGNGDPTNSLSVAAYCIPFSESPAVNTTAGLPGPGRIRQEAVVVPNFTSLP